PLPTPSLTLFPYTTLFRSNRDLDEVFFPHEILSDVPNLARIVEQDQTHGSGDVDVLLDVEEQTLVPAEDQARRRVLGPDGSDVEDRKSTRLNSSHVSISYA